jgi:tRNA (guanine37-N1)-methyltransferase
MTRQFSFISIHPNIIEGYRAFGVFKAAEKADLAKIWVTDLRDFASDKHGSVDASPYGGGDGMVMRVDCLAKAVNDVRASLLDGDNAKIVFTSPSGKQWTQDDAKMFSEMKQPLIFICGRFAGVDQRFVDRYVDYEYSVGDVVLAGGELPTLMMAESILRLVHGVLGHQNSAEEDSFGAGVNGLLEYPSYTRPPEWEGAKVPEVLLSGDHETIKKWRSEQALRRTEKLRPDILARKRQN